MEDRAGVVINLNRGLLILFIRLGHLYGSAFLL
jgi:hypothetical protein